MQKVSVIIPVYNAEKYLKECLDSVISQTLTDIEIICIDDGSTDNSLAILQEYPQKDERIIVLKQKNKGAGIARNLGIKQAKGEFVAFMDSDDKYPDENTLELMFVKAKENNVFICGGEFSFFTSENSTLTQNFLESDRKYSFEKDEVIEYKNYQFDYGYHRFIYNKEFLLKNGLFFPNYRRFQDPPFFVKAMIKAERFFALNKITYCHRIFHQNVIWDNLRIQHLLLGLLDNYKLANKYGFEELKQTTTNRFFEHWERIKDDINLKEIIILSSISKYDLNIKNHCKNNKLTIIQRYVSPILRSIFSLRNSEDKKHKIITIFGIKLELKRKNR